MSTLRGLAVTIIRRLQSFTQWWVELNKPHTQKFGHFPLAWLNRCRRLAKDFENLTDNALAFLRLASVRLMLRRLCNPS